MQIVEISRRECSELLTRVSTGRLACSLDNQPYVVPVSFAYDDGYIYIFSTLGRKIEWMRANPKVCLQVGEIGNRSNWTSVVITGTYKELPELQYAAERERARQKLAEYAQWWQIPLAERREKISDLAIESIFFRIDIESMTGLRAMPETG